MFRLGGLSLKWLGTWGAVAMVACLSLPVGCTDAVGCKPTTTTARGASKVDLAAAPSSATLSARLAVAADDQPLSGKVLRFSVLDHGAAVYSASASAGTNGVASLDLKRLEPNALAAIARGDSFRAAFAGDNTYCSSSDDAPFRLVGGVPTG